MTMGSVVRRVLVLPPLLALTLIGCATAAGEEPTASRTFEVSQPRTPTPTPTPSLPPGAEDVWEMGLSGDLYADLEVHYDGLHELTGDNGMISAAEWVAMLHDDICESDTEPMGGLGSDMDNGVRMVINNPDGYDKHDAVRVIASYGCPERKDLVQVALLKAG